MDYHFQFFFVHRGSPVAKNVKEAAGGIRFLVFPQETDENSEKPIFSERMFKIFRKCPNASEHLQMHSNASEHIRTGPNKSETFEKLAKTSKIPEKNHLVTGRK